MNDKIESKSKVSIFKTRAVSQVSRRGFLGLAAVGTVFLSFLAVLVGALRLVKPNVFYEESRKVKIGVPAEFPVGVVKLLEDKKAFIYSNADGFHAISQVCTHLGCLVSRTEAGFQCPCHGSKFNAVGKVTAGPAPRPLPWLELSQSVDGQLIVDTSKEVKIGTKFKVRS